MEVQQPQCQLAKEDNRSFETHLLRKKACFQHAPNCPDEMSCYCGKTWKQPNSGIHCFKVFDNRNSRFATVPSSKKQCFYEHGVPVRFFSRYHFFRRIWDHPQIFTCWYAISPCRRWPSDNFICYSNLVGVWNMFYFPIILGMENHPNWHSLTHIFQRGRSTTSHAMCRELLSCVEAAYIVRAILQIRSAASACPEPKCHGEAERRSAMGLTSHGKMRETSGCSMDVNLEIMKLVQFDEFYGVFGRFLTYGFLSHRGTPNHPSYGWLFLVLKQLRWLGDPLFEEPPI